MSAYLAIDDLTVELNRQVPLLRGVSLSVDVGKVHGLVGESGAGKSLIGKSVLGILPDALTVKRGSILLDGQDLQTLKPKIRREVIGAKAALIPQDPLTALNPVRRIGPQITRRLVDILGWTKSDAQARALELLDEVHIPDPERIMQTYPHELSGGMRQRILIASAFAAEPKLIVADEPTTALDVTVQKRILKLIREMQDRHGSALLFVTHDLGVISKTVQSLSVLYSGRIKETAEMRAFFASPQHPYSRSLLAATPKYTDPQGSLLPVSAEVTQTLDQEVAAWDREHGYV
ncbi:MAG: ABC transporter ATP-binding protein [Paracoccaceae bacterium]